MKAYLTLSHGDESLGTLRLTLRPDIVPRTVENFVHFLTAQAASGDTSSGSGKGGGGSSSALVGNSGGGGGQGYRGSTFHRIIPKFMAQGGDFLRHDGTGSTSVHGPSFADENFLLSHSQRGTLSMANSGPDTNGCQFFIAFRATAHLDGRHVVFGHVDWREDDETAEALERLERVRTDRRTDRPLVPVRIADCGVVGDGKAKVGRAGEGGGGGDRLVGEAKKTRLLRAYGDVDPAAADDDDEIDLDEADEEADGPENDARGDANASQTAGEAGEGDADEIDLDDENDEPAEEDDAAAGEGSEPAVPAAGGKLSKKAALKKRLAALRTKINQSRTLNRREVRAEAARMGTDEAAAAERKRQNKQDRNARKKEYDTYVVGKLRDGGGGDEGKAGSGRAEQKRMAGLSQPAYDSIRRMNVQAERKERGVHGPDDYYNPEGQYSNYERNLNSVRHLAPRRAEEDLDLYDPTQVNNRTGGGGNHRDGAEKQGAKRLANEMKRRAEKKANKKQKVEFDAVDVTSINDRNKRFNQKIGRNFDKHTVEIRQNLERGTAM